jgi:hypothetical protein
MSFSGFIDHWLVPPRLAVKYVSMFPVLLRILLSLTLVLDGSGTAIASTMAVQGMPMTMAQSPTSDGHDAPGPCHETDEVASSPEEQSMHPIAPDPQSPAPDCCKSGTCACANAQPAQFAAHSTLRQVFANSRAHVVHPTQLKFTTPAQRQPIRPPIG